jgi:cation transporter-like permease
MSTIIFTLLLQVAGWLVHWLWSQKIDPDNAAIPYLTSLGDLLGGALLALAFNLFYSVFASPVTKNVGHDLQQNLEL